MIDIHVRISRRLVFWIVAFIIAGFVIPFILANVGGSHPRVGPTQTFQTP